MRRTVRHVVAAYKLGCAHDDFVLAVSHGNPSKRGDQHIMVQVVQEAQLARPIVSRDVPDVVAVDLVFGQNRAKRSEGVRAAFRRPLLCFRVARL